MTTSNNSADGSNASHCSSAWTGWIIVKASRTGGGRSYEGPTWDRARIREQRQAVYDDKELAEKHAKELTKFNGAGFIVEAVCVTQNF
jgi:hypothetical protein